MLHRIVRTFKSSFDSMLLKYGRPIILFLCLFCSSSRYTCFPSFSRPLLLLDVMSLGLFSGGKWSLNWTMFGGTLNYTLAHDLIFQRSDHYTRGWAKRTPTHLNAPSLPTSSPREGSYCPETDDI